MTENTQEPEKVDFIRNIIRDDLAAGRHTDDLVFRFPPEPNGHLHIGHAKSICLNFGLAKEFSARCHLRFDDTNPLNEDESYMHAIKQDVSWLGCDWGDHLYYASDYFEMIYRKAVLLIEKGLAYVESLPADQIREYRGTLTEPGKPSPYRDRSVEENVDLFKRMRAGEFTDGEHCLRAKIDLSSGNLNMRDPVLYRIRHAHHDRTGDTWCIYPLYDFTHALSDATEGITHSLCTLEFQDHRPLYDWVVENCDMEHTPRQIEFSRLNLNYTVMSKRYLKKLVEEKLVSGWDDPRLPTISGLRRRGYTAESIRQFCSDVGISKSDSMINMTQLEDCLRSDLNQKAPRRMAVLDPLLVELVNYEEAGCDHLLVSNHPQDSSFGKRDVAFTRDLYIERSDFMMEPVKGFKRLSPDGRARLMNGFVITCESVETNAEGEVTKLVCRLSPETLGGKPLACGTKVRGVIHWVSKDNAVDADIRLYDRLFKVENPMALEAMEEALNADSLKTVVAKVEPSLLDAEKQAHYQFSRVGYFCSDSEDHDPKSGKLVFNQAVPLRSTWS